MTAFECRDCGKTFEVRGEVLERYPGWEPGQCLDCRDKSKGTGPSGPRRRSASKSRDLTVTEVLSSFEAGPSTGVFTDGAAEGNPGPGGWGAVHVVDDRVIDEAMGSEGHTTNNRMELTAMVAGLGMLDVDASIDVYTDSQLIVNTLNEWAPRWRANGWKKKSAGPIANLELVQEAYRLYVERPGVTVRWIAAHSGYKWNEYADSLATSYRREVH